MTWRDRKDHPQYAVNLGNLRRDVRLSHPQLAKEARVSLDLLFAIERGLGRPSIEVHQKIVSALGYDPFDLDRTFRPRRGKRKGKKFRGDKQWERDPDFGIHDPDFWRWWHRVGKRKQGGDLVGRDGTCWRQGEDYGIV